MRGYGKFPEMAFTLNDFSAFPIGTRVRRHGKFGNGFHASPTETRIRRHGKFGKQRFIQHKEIEMRRELTALREQMRKHNIDWYLIPSSDPHGSEYLNPHFRCREYISGFTGSAGTLLVGMDEAYLWTDGRYFIQAASQLTGSGISLMKSGEKDVPTVIQFLKDLSEKQMQSPAQVNGQAEKSGDSDAQVQGRGEKRRMLPAQVPAGLTLGFDGKVISMEAGLELNDMNFNIVSEIDLVDKVWQNRPRIIPSPIYDLPLSSVGKTFEEKLSDVRVKMKNKTADLLLISSPEEIAWLFNMRGNDIEYTPVFFAYALISRSDCLLFVSQKNLPPTFSLCRTKNYDCIGSYLQTLPKGKTLWLSGKRTNFALYVKISSPATKGPDTDSSGAVKIIDEPTPVEMMKAVKNTAEIASTEHAHIKDGVAMVNFIHRLRHSIGKKEITEISAAKYLLACRKKQPGFIEPSFATISGYNSNGAIIHYNAIPETNRMLEASGFLLIDSGGQYIDGTTDITRTISLGELSCKMKKYYTYVLKSHIALASATFSPGTTGVELDRIARKPLQSIGLDYNHGTGHGVGHISSVHEGPNTISPRGGNVAFLPGMITSNEPGVYIENEFGIRLENEMLCVRKPGERYGFKTLTLCPFDPESILFDLLTEQEAEWLNTYHDNVVRILTPLLKPKVAAWLKDYVQMR